MSAFFDAFERSAPRPSVPEPEQPCAQNATIDVCRYCGIADPDVLLGVCGACVE